MRPEDMWEERRCWGPVRAPSSIRMWGQVPILTCRNEACWHGAGGFPGSEWEVAVGSSRSISNSVFVALPIPALSWRLD